MRKLAAVFLLVLLSGCFTAGDQANRQTTSQGPVTVAIPLPTSPPPGGNESKAVAGPELDRLRNDVSASSNATQQSLTGLGLQVAKIGEHVEGIHAEINNRLDVVANATAIANAQIKAQIETTATVNAKAVADLKAEFNAQISALVAGQAGVNNRIDETKQTISAGHDATTSTTQFTKDMSETLIQSERSHSRTMIAIVGSLCGVLTAFLEASRKRAKKQSDDLYNHFVRPGANEPNRETKVIKT